MIVGSDQRRSASTLSEASAMTDRLYRSRDDRMFAGVAGGLADLLDADPSLVRLVWALLVIFTGGIALIVYIVMAFVVPEEPERSSSPSAAAAAPAPPPAPGLAPTAADGTPSPAVGPAPATAPSYWGSSRREARAARRAARRQRGDSAAPAIVGVFLVILGGFFLLREWIPQLDFDWFWPLMLIGLGVLLLVLAVGRRPGDPGSAR
jgi:phage shock protein C